MANGTRPIDDLPAGTVVSRGELLAAGWSANQIDQQRRSGGLRVLQRGLYVRSGPDSALLELHAALRSTKGAGTAVLGSAAGLYGLQGVWPRETRPQIAVPPGQERRQRHGIVFHVWTLQPDETTQVDGLQATTPLRTVCDLARHLDRAAAIAVMDSALHLGLVEAAELQAQATLLRGLRGAARCRPWWDLADGKAESPLETRVRLRAIDAGHPPVELQRPVLKDGRVIARVDLAWRRRNGRWLFGEADGVTPHDTPQAVFRDRSRSNAIGAATAADIVRFTWRDTLKPSTIANVLASFDLAPPDDLGCDGARRGG